MEIRTGQTINELILSVNSNNVVITGVTFNTSMFKDGTEYTGLTITETLADASKGLYNFSWSASTTGSYQLYIKNNTTSVPFVSDVYLIQPDNYFQPNIYVGL